jgi:hypothetical protein
MRSYFNINLLIEEAAYNHHLLLLGILEQAILEILNINIEYKSIEQASTTYSANALAAITNCITIIL